jgi:hypothetical protein
MSRKKKKVVALISKQTPKWLKKFLFEFEGKGKGSVTVVDISPLSLSAIISMGFQPKIIELVDFIPKRKRTHKKQ